MLKAERSPVRHGMSVEPSVARRRPPSHRLTEVTPLAVKFSGFVPESFRKFGGDVYFRTAAALRPRF
jgi:hypothetical protein